MNKEPKVIKLGKLPKGNRLLKYCKQLDEIINNNKNSFCPFLESIYEDCKNFLIRNEYVTWLPTIDLFFVPTHAEYLIIEKKREEGAIQKEVSVGQTYGFVVGSRFNKKFYIDMELHLNLLAYNAATFIIGLIETYIHELLHCAFNEELLEQKIYEIQCNAVEDFLDIKYPPHVKNRRASDYYTFD